jgi:putative component of toxin-antitoxin plasmid stabilization module
MPRTEVVLFQEEDGTVPILEWLDHLYQPKAVAKCRAMIERLKQMGHELQRPEADYLRDGIHELRIRLGSVNYRLLYFFHGPIAAVISHGVIKEDKVPAKEIERAVHRMMKFTANPKLHTYTGPHDDKPKKNQNGNGRR